MAEDMVGNVTNLTIHVTQNVHSLWSRDTGPVFVRSLEGDIDNEWEGGDPGVGFDANDTSSDIVGMLLSFNNWGRKDDPSPDFFFGGYAAQVLNMSSRLAPFIAEGGGLEVDGEGTLLTAESAILNPNRNPGIDRATMERYFSESLGIKKTIWIPGTRGGDITDDHIDSIARFTAPGTVLLSKPFHDFDGFDEARRILSNATDAEGRKLQIIEVPEPEALGDGSSAASLSYVNYHVVNGAVILGVFGDEEYDEQAAQIIGQQYPGRVVEQVLLREVAVQGGGVHCATQNVPA